MLSGRQGDRVAIIKNVHRRGVSQQQAQRGLAAHDPFRARTDQLVYQAPAVMVGDFHPADGAAAQAQLHASITDIVRRRWAGGRRGKVLGRRCHSRFGGGFGNHGGPGRVRLDIGDDRRRRALRGQVSDR